MVKGFIIVLALLCWNITAFALEGMSEPEMKDATAQVATVAGGVSDASAPTAGVASDASPVVAPVAGVFSDIGPLAAPVMLTKEIYDDSEDIRYVQAVIDDMSGVTGMFF